MAEIRVAEIQVAKIRVTEILQALQISLIVKALKP